METPPAIGPNFKQLATSQFYIELPDEIIWQYRGATYGWQRIALKSELSDVAFSGLYADLIGLPDIPAEAPVQSVNGRIGDVVGLAEQSDLLKAVPKISAVYYVLSESNDIQCDEAIGSFLKVAYKGVFGYTLSVNNVASEADKTFSYDILTGILSFPDTIGVDEPIKFTYSGYGDSTNVPSSVVTQDELLDYALKTELNYTQAVTQDFFFGVDTPVTGVTTATGRTRVDVTPVNKSGIVTNLVVFAFTPGLGKFKFLTKNLDGTYNLVPGTEKVITLVEGENVFDASFFGSTYTVEPNWYPAFYVSSPASISGTSPGGSNNFFFLAVDVSGNNVTPTGSSGLLLQYKLTVKSVTIPAVTLKNEIDNVKSDLDDRTIFEDIYSVTSGQESPTLADDAGTSRTRIDFLQLPIVTGIKRLTKFEVYCNVAGTGKIKFISKNIDGTFNLEKQFSYNFEVGLNTITSTTFGTAFTLGSGWYVGLYAGSAHFSAVTAGVSSSYLYIGEFNGTSVTVSSTSLFLLQYKATIEVDASKTVKEAIEQIQDGSGTNVLYVNSATGNDSNAGDIPSRQLATLNKAIEISVGKPSVQIYASGDFREELDFSAITFEHIEITKQAKAVVRVMGSNKLGSFTKVSGRTNIYSAAYSGTIATWSRAEDPIMEDKNSSRAILSDEIHPLQKGLFYRLPFTPIFKSATGVTLSDTLTILDANPGTYHFDVSNNILYLHATGSSNPSTNGFVYEVPNRNANKTPIITNLSIRPNLVMNGIQFVYLGTGFQCNGWGMVHRTRCSIIGVAANGLTAGGWRDDTSAVVSYFDEAAYADGDGFNGHYNRFGDFASQDAREGSGLGIYYDFWAHDNFDDGMSHHERHTVAVYGGLTEYNGDRGFIPAQGCQATAYDLLARKNGQDVSANSGAGIAVTNPAVDGRTGTSLYCYNCVSENNTKGFVAHDDANNKLVAISCISRNNTLGEYCTTGSAKLIIKNCLATNANSAIRKIGNVTIENDTLLT